MKLSPVRVTLMEYVLECLNVTLNVFIHIYEFNYEGKVTLRRIRTGRCAGRAPCCESPGEACGLWAGREQSPAGHHLRLHMLRWRRSL